MATPFKHPRTSIYYLRRSVPIDLRGILGSEIKKSLKTKDLQQAKKLFAIAFAESEDKIRLARRSLEDGDSLNAKDLQILAERFLAKELAAFENEGDFSRGKIMPYISLAATVMIEKTKEAHKVRLDKLGAFANQLLLDHKLAIATDSSDYYQLLIAMAKRVIDLSIRIVDRTTGDWSTKPSEIKDHSLSVKSVAKPTGKDVLDITKLFDKYSQNLLRINAGKDTTAKNRINDYNAVVRRFAEMYGNKSINDVTRQDIAVFREQLLQLPARKPLIAELPMVKQAEIAVTEGFILLSPNTVKTSLNKLSAVFQYAVDNFILNINPVHGSTKVIAQNKPKTVLDDKGYNTSELGIIFNSALINGKHRPEQANFGEAIYWLPLLAYYTGARIEELAQLYVADVRCDDSIHYLLIHESGNDQSVKNQGSVRRIPLHNDLLSLGFTEYVESLQAKGRVFPELKINGKGKYSGRVSIWLAKYFRKDLKINPDIKPLHGFRHAFKTLARDAGIPEDIRDVINGHSTGGVGRTYGSYSMALLKSEIDKFPSISNAKLLAVGYKLAG